jgi:hypothetical protein
LLVLWWLVPPLAATLVAMLWVTWAGRERDEVKRDDSDEAMERMERALARPAPQRGKPVRSVPIEPTHGVAIRGLGRLANPNMPDEPPASGDRGTRIAG